MGRVPSEQLLLWIGQIHTVLMEVTKELIRLTSLNEITRHRKSESNICSSAFALLAD